MSDHSTMPSNVGSNAGLGAGTDLYRSALAFNADDHDAKRKALMAKVWCGTPWMVDAYVGSCETRRRHDVMKWCRDQFGLEARPIHGHAGQWRSGGATINGWSWMGFATEDQMRRFMDCWPTPNVF